MSWKTTGLLPANKAPGPTVLQGNFYQCCWPVIKDDVMAVVSAIWSRKFMTFEQLKLEYITLLMKKDEATSIRDFRPVSLVHSFIKIGIAVCLMVFPQKWWVSYCLQKKRHSFGAWLDREGSPCCVGTVAPSD
jgi:hypothetical protein